MIRDLELYNGERLKYGPFSLNMDGTNEKKVPEVFKSLVVFQFK